MIHHSRKRGLVIAKPIRDAGAREDLDHLPQAKRDELARVVKIPFSLSTYAGATSLRFSGATPSRPKPCFGTNIIPS